MNKVFDYNGTFVSASKPTKTLKRVKKTFLVDSADRDTVKYYTNGDFVVYLPRVYENVVSLRLMAGEFPLLVCGTASSILSFSISGTTVTATVSSTTGLNNGDYVTVTGSTSSGNDGTFQISGLTSSTFNYTNPAGVTEAGSGGVINLGARMHSYVNGQNVASSKFINDNGLLCGDYYFLIDIEGLNKTDECSVQAERSAYADSYFAKIPSIANCDFIQYNDNSCQENIAHFTPAISKLDRLHIRTRLHSQQGNKGFIYWTNDRNYASGSNVRGSEFSLSFEVEYLDNVFDDFSQFETRIN
jgi:hypothetical protein